MMKRTITAAALLLSTFTLAHAEPTQKELEARAKELEKKLKGQGYTVLVEPPFVVIGDSAAQGREADHDRLSAQQGRRCSRRTSSPSAPTELLEVWLFKNEKSFRKGTKKFFKDAPETPYGYYSPDENALIMNALGPGHAVARARASVHGGELPRRAVVVQRRPRVALRAARARRTATSSAASNWRLPEPQEGAQGKDAAEHRRRCWRRRATSSTRPSTTRTRSRATSSTTCRSRASCRTSTRSS